MDHKAKIEAAIDAHTKWIVRLRVAIETAASDFKPAIVKTDNNCEFGKWLYGEFPAQLVGTPVHREIKGLHAQFHAEAGSILEQALAKKKAEAIKAMDPNGSFKKLSLKLISALRELEKRA